MNDFNSFELSHSSTPGNENRQATPIFKRSFCFSNDNFGGKFSIGLVKRNSLELFKRSLVCEEEDFTSHVKRHALSDISSPIPMEEESTQESGTQISTQEESFETFGFKMSEDSCYKRSRFNSMSKRHSSACDFQFESEIPESLYKQYEENYFEASMLKQIELKRHPDLNTISAKTLSELIEGKFKNIVNFVIIDCRFNYEFQGGKIQSAINLNRPDELETTFFAQQSTIQDNMSKKTIFIFHCEFSQNRGPKMYRKMREIDRAMHQDSYPRLYYPEIYILEGGYKEFYESYSNLCEPQAYVSMNDKRFKDQCKKKLLDHRMLFRLGSECNNNI